MKQYRSTHGDQTRNDKDQVRQATQAEVEVVDFGKDEREGFEPEVEDTDREEVSTLDVQVVPKQTHE